MPDIYDQPYRGLGVCLKCRHWCVYIEIPGISDIFASEMVHEAVIEHESECLPASLAPDDVEAWLAA